MLMPPLMPGAGGSKLVVISIDGLDFRYLKDADRLHLKIPVLRKLMAQGAVADGVIGFPPAESWPAITTIVTGVPPSRHGIVFDDRLDQTSSALTLWQAATNGRLKTALLYWPATTTSSGDFVCPQVWDKPHLSEALFDPIAQKCTTGLVDRIAKVYPRFTKSLWDDESAMLALNYLLQYEKPDLSLVHLAELDPEEHQTGALSLYSRELLENDDDLLGQMLPKLPPHSVVAIVSDHGFETEDHVIRPRVLTGSSAVQVKYGLIGTTDLRVAAILRKLIGVKKDGIAREVPITEVRRYAPELRGWVAAFGTMPGYIAVDEAKGPAVGPGSHKGVHGLWPTRPNYRSVFLVWGYGVKAGHMGEISSLEIAPTLASIIGVALPEAKQPSLWPKLKK
jgi:predicted AlkP superfamily pyrophosphatase or phosphodiesterase